MNFRADDRRCNVLIDGELDEREDLEIGFGRVGDLLVDHDVEPAVPA